ncbi:hypothetical protein AM1H77_11320 [Apilactobacillus micheneri]
MKVCKNQYDDFPAIVASSLLSDIVNALLIDIIFKILSHFTIIDRKSAYKYVNFINFISYYRN